MAKLLSIIQLVTLKVEYKLIKPFIYMERHICMNLQTAEIKTRPADSNGLWCHSLLPIALLVYSWCDKVSLLYKITSLISFGLFCYCIMFLIFLSTSSDVLKEPVYSSCIVCSIIASMLMVVLLKQDLTFSICITFLSITLFAWLLQMCVTEFDYTFTIGEAMIVSQGVVLFFEMSLIKFFFELYSDDEEFEFISIIVYTVLSTVGLIVAVLYILKESDRNLITLGYIIFSAAAFVLLILHSILGSNCLYTILHYIFVERNRARIFTFWLILLILAICALLMRTKLAVKASTVTRKTYHVLASLVFLSGIVLDINLITLAAGLGLGVLIFVEALRKSGIEPISSALQSAFLVYCDEKDCGLFAMTPLYLYVGLAFPLLIVPNRADRELELLSGVLSIGVGDTAASWFGSRYGFNKWPDSNRTVEGMIFNILSQVGTVYALILFGLLNTKGVLMRAFVGASVSALVEARTAQVDNLVLPLVSIIAFQASWLFL